MDKIISFSIILLFLFVAINDTASGFLISILDFLIEGDDALVLSAYWIENRMMLIASIVLLLILYYRPVFRRYLGYSELYTNPFISNVKPLISPFDAAYILSRSKVSCLSNWIIEMCHIGAMKLHYNFGTSRFSAESLYPWSIGKTENTSKLTTTDKGVMDRLFATQDTVILKAFFHNPNKEVLNAADYLLKETDKKNKHLIKPINNEVLLAYALLMILFLELPLLSSLNEKPALFFICMGMAMFVAAATFVFVFFFNALLDRNIIAVCGVAFVFSIVGLVLWYMSDLIDEGSFFYFCLYPNISVILVVLIHNMPQLPANMSLFQQLIAYKNHLEQQQKFSKQEIIWRLALDVGNNLFQHNWRYDDTLPGWLKSNEADPHKTILALQASFSVSLRKAVLGELKGHSSSNFPSITDS